MALGDPVATRDSPAPDKSDKEKEEWVKRAEALALQYRMELLKPLIICRRRGRTRASRIVSGGWKWRISIVRKSSARCCGRAI